MIIITIYLLHIFDLPALFLNVRSVSFVVLNFLEHTIQRDKLRLLQISNRWQSIAQTAENNKKLNCTTERESERDFQVVHLQIP